MNLFVVGWGLSPEVLRRTAAELRRTAALYPQLDHAAGWQRQLPGGVLVGGVASGSSVAGPREYVHHGTPKGALTLYDGLPIDPTGTIEAHRAEQLDSAWPSLTTTLEGRFCIVRVQAEPLEIELINDPCGVEQVYASESGGMSIVSNSAGLIQRALGLTEPDALGVSLFLALDWVGGDRTLRRGVHVLPGAQHWSWRAGDRSWTRRAFWNINAIAGRPVRLVDRALVDEVVEPLTRFCSAAATVTGSAYAPLTGGRDSRLLAAILIAGRIPASYWTKGDAGSLDVKIGGEVATRYGLPHRFSNRPTQVVEGRDPTLDVGTEWETLSETFVAQNDGLASLYNIGNIQGQPDRIEHLAVTFTAMCAEAARAPYGAPYLTAPGASAPRTSRFLAYMLTSRPRGLIRPEAYELAQTEDKVVPFQTRAYVESALSMLPRERSRDRLHHEVIRALVPGLESVPPFDKPSLEEVALPGRAIRLRNDLMPRLPYPALRGLVMVRDALHSPRLARTPFAPYDEASWLEMNLGWARDVCLANDGSGLWSFVDRRKLELLLSAATPAESRRVFQFPLFAAMTMFEFERVERTLQAQEPV